MSPPVPGDGLAGCFVLREAADAMALRSWRQTKSCETAVVLGGGVLGIETADALRQLNLKVTVVQRDDRLMNRNWITRAAPSCAISWKDSVSAW